MTTIAESRLRPHAAVRFAGPEHGFDLAGTVAALRTEAHPASQGHRQKTLYRHGALTLAVFAFDPGAELADHQANGVVTIQCLDGALNVHTAEHTYELAPSGLVVLAPGVRHGVRAGKDAPAAMLLGVCRTESDAAPTADVKGTRSR